jgi:methyl-accepting chemotaxis protein
VTEKEGLLEKIAARGSLMRLLMLSTLGLGVVTGALFPFFVQAVLGLPGEVVFRPGFVLACLAAGFLVGFLNYVLVRFLLARVLKNLSFAAQRLARGDLA